MNVGQCLKGGFDLNSPLIIPKHCFNTTCHLTIVFSSIEKGGWLFEYYLHSCSGYAVNELYESYLNAPDASTKSSMFVDILKKCASHFSGWLLFHINSVGTLGRKQMFYITFVDHYFGLSRIELNSAIGYGVTLGMYGRERKRHE